MLLKKNQGSRKFVCRQNYFIQKSYDDVVMLCCFEICEKNVKINRKLHRKKNWILIKIHLKKKILIKKI